MHKRIRKARGPWTKAEARQVITSLGVEEQVRINRLFVWRDQLGYFIVKNRRGRHANGWCCGSIASTLRELGF